MERNGESAAPIVWHPAHPSGILENMGTNSIDRFRAFGDALRMKPNRRTRFALYTAAPGREVA